MPLVVSDVGWFSELSDAVAVKVTPDEREVDTLASELERLLGDDAARQAMGAAALELAADGAQARPCCGRSTSRHSRGGRR